MPLIIVESPTKARTIKAILGEEFEVISSYGHIRDLPKNELGIDVEHNFEPRYIIPSKAQKHVKSLREAAAKANEILLSTDEDREGEAIAYHIKRVLQDSGFQIPDSRFKRIAFHEITSEAIREALLQPRDIDLLLIDSQKARRILDRLVGYKLSPLLWKKIVRGISAGRVQSAALRLIVEREEERKKFISQEYWTIEADFKIQNPHFAKGEMAKLKSKIQNVLTAVLEKINGEKLDKLAIKSEEEAEKIKNGLEHSTFTIEDITKKPFKKLPEPPFITSTLQQVAGMRLGLRASFTMQLAQKLYETGKITYMRTDSTLMAQSALAKAGAFIEGAYGKEYVKIRQWKTKVKLAQEAHEAIRPTDFSFTPEKAKQALEGRQSKLYTLIWQRALGSQMSEALFEKTKIIVEGVRNQELGVKDKKTYTLAAIGSQLLFDGFMKVYPQKVEDKILPEVKKDDTPILKEVRPSQHFTQPPPRFSEATLIKTLKELGIGRPSTYAPIVDIIQKRYYVNKDEAKKLEPTDLGIAVNTLLCKHFPDIVDFDFTAQMEESLDQIAQGGKSSLEILKSFYTPFEKRLKEKQKELQKEEFTQEETDKACPQCQAPVVKKLGRFGHFYSCSRFPDCKWAQAINTSIGMKCPQCKEGEVVERRTKRGKLFYGCSGYPACKFASWQKPKKENSL